MRLKSIRCHLAIGALFVICACENPHSPGYRFSSSDNALKVAGPPGARFSASYQSARGSGTLTFAIKDNEPCTVIKTPDSNLRADVRKNDPSLPLAVEVCRGDHRIFHVDIPPGKEGARVEPKGLNWRAEIY